MGTHPPAVESFTDIVFLILLVKIGDGHHGNAVPGYLWVVIWVSHKQWSMYAEEETCLHLTEY